MARERSDRHDAVRITTAADEPQRRHRGAAAALHISMGIRTVCFVGAIIASLAGMNWLWPFLIVAALVLPYVAVVMANAANRRRTTASRCSTMGSVAPSWVSGSEAVRHHPRTG